MPDKSQENDNRSQFKDSGRGKGFVRDVLKLASGTSVAQGMAVLVSPLVSRLYGPEAFGALAVYTSITSILVVVACLRYELAIMLPDSDREAANLLVLSLVAVAAVAGMSAVILWFWRVPLLRALRAPHLLPHVWLVPVATVCGGGANAFTYWHTRARRYGRLSLTRVISSVSNQAAKVSAGFAGWGGGGLIGAALLGSGAAFTALGAHAVRHDWQALRRHIRLGEVLAMARRYRRFPTIDIWTGLLNALSWQLPALLLARFFADAIVGYYSFGFSVLQMPMSVVGGAIGQVFFQRAAQARREGGLQTLLSAMLRQLAAIIMPFALIIGLAGQELFAFVFGAGWSEAGRFMQILTPWMIFWFLSSPLSTMVSLMERQAMGLGITVGIVISRAISLWIGGRSGSPDLALALYSGTGVMLYGYALLRFLRAGGLSEGDSLAILGRAALRVLPFGAPILLARLGRAPTWVMLSVAFGTAAALGAQYVWRASRETTAGAEIWRSLMERWNRHAS